MNKKIIIIAGPNGAGKTTLAFLVKYASVSELSHAAHCEA